MYPLGSLLSGGIDSSLVSRAAQSEVGRLKTFNVRFPEAHYDETWAAVAVGQHIDSKHETLDITEGSGNWESVTSLLHSCGPALCRRVAVRGECYLPTDATACRRGLIGRRG